MFQRSISRLLQRLFIGKEFKAEDWNSCGVICHSRALQNKNCNIYSFENEVCKVGFLKDLNQIKLQGSIMVKYLTGLSIKYSTKSTTSSTISTTGTAGTAGTAGTTSF